MTLPIRKPQLPRVNRFGAVVQPDDPEYAELEPESSSSAQQSKEPGASIRPTLPVAVVANSVESIKLRSKRHAEATLDLCSLNAMRTAIGLLFRVNAKHDKRFWTLKTTCYELSRSLGLHYNLGRKQAEELLREVASIVFTIRRGKRFAAIPVTAIAELDEDGGIRLKLNKELEPYLLDLQADYRKLHRRALRLRSPRTLLLYQFLRGFVGLNQPRHRVALTDLQRVMHCEGMPWKDFRRHHLKPAITDIKRRTELVPDYKVKRARPEQKRGLVEELVFTTRQRRVLPIVEIAPLIGRNSSPTSRNSSPTGRNASP